MSFAQERRSKAWVIPISLMALVVGLLLSAAWITRDNISARAQSLSPDQRERMTVATLDVEEELAGMNVQLQQARDEVRRLREENDRLAQAMSAGDEAVDVLNQQLDNSKVFAGLVEVSGPGVMVTLRDASEPTSDDLLLATAQTIHDTDVLRTLNELWSAGAEAVSVNGKRMVSGSSVRCVGPVVIVDGEKFSVPIVIRAIGDAATLRGALLMPGGIVAELRDVDPQMVSVEAMEQMTVPAYDGGTAWEHATVGRDEASAEE